MRFIREIIAEKTNLDAGGEHPQGTDEASGPLVLQNGDAVAQKIDPVHRVAAGGRSLGGADQADLQGDGQMEQPEDSPDTDMAQDLADADEEFEIEDISDRIEDIAERLDPADTSTDATEANKPSELFAGLWDGGKTTPMDAEEDIFAPDAPDIEVSDTHPADPEPSEPGSNANALMRTLYPDSAEASEPDLPETAPASDETEIEAAEQEAPALSAFQRISRRQAAVPAQTQSAPETMPEPEVATETIAPIAVPAPAAGRARRQAGRVKTRLLGFGNEPGRDSDPFAAPSATEPASQTMFPVGWIVVVAGPGRGSAFNLFSGVSQIGRGEGQAVRLDFGDTSISRENHAAVAFDPEQQAFFLGHGGKTNLVRLNNMPVLSTEPLSNGALIRIGETTLKFVGLCGADFDWDKTQNGEVGNAHLG